MYRVTISIKEKKTLSVAGVLMASKGALAILYASIARGSGAKGDFSLDVTSNDSLRTSFKMSRWYTDSLLIPEARRSRGVPPSF